MTLKDQVLSLLQYFLLKSGFEEAPVLIKTLHEEFNNSKEEMELLSEIAIKIVSVLSGLKLKSTSKVASVTSVNQALQNVDLLLMTEHYLDIIAASPEPRTNDKHKMLFDAFDEEVAALEKTAKLATATSNSAAVASANTATAIAVTTNVATATTALDPMSAITATIPLATDTTSTGILKALIAIGIKPTPQKLFELVVEGKLATLKVYADIGVALDIANQQGETLLHCAVKNIKPEVLEFLLQRGLSPDSLDSRGRSPLDWCGNQVHALKLLVTWGAIRGSTEWISNRKAELQKLIAELKNEKEEGEILKQLQQLSVFECAIKGNLPAMQTLVSQGMDLMAKHLRTALTPLHYSLKNGNLHITEYLLKNDAIIKCLADTPYLDPQGRSLLSHTHPQVSEKLVNTLLDSGVKCTLKDFEFFTGCAFHNPSIIRWIYLHAKSKKEDVELQMKLDSYCYTDKNRNTLLHLVVKRIEVAELVAKAQGEILNKEQLQKETRQLMVNLLAISKTMINAKNQSTIRKMDINKNEWSPVMYAAYMGAEGLVLELAQNGARTLDLDNTRRTIYDLIQLGIKERGHVGAPAFNRITTFLQTHNQKLADNLVNAVCVLNNDGTFGNFEAITTLVKEGADVNKTAATPPILYNPPFRLGRTTKEITPLIAAIILGQEKLVNFFTKTCKADPNIAARFDKFDDAMMFLGNVRHKKNSTKRTPFDFARHEFALLKPLLLEGAIGSENNDESIVLIQEWLTQIAQFNDHELLFCLHHNKHYMRLLFHPEKRNGSSWFIRNNLLDNRVFTIDSNIRSDLEQMEKELSREEEGPGLNLRAVAAHRESSWLKMSADQNDIVTNVRKHYESEFTKRKGTETILADLKKYLEEQFVSDQSNSSDPSFDPTDPMPRARPTYNGQPLTLACSNITDPTLRELYYMDPFHTAWRYMATQSNPNPLMSAEARYVSRDWSDQTKAWPNIKPQDRELMAYLWLAASDKTIKPVGMSNKRMMARFADELAYMNRGHNYDKQKIKINDLCFLSVSNNEVPATASLPKMPDKFSAVVLMSIGQIWQVAFVIDGKWLTVDQKLHTQSYRNNKLPAELQAIHKEMTEKSLAMVNLKQYKYSRNDVVRMDLFQRKTIRKMVDNLLETLATKFSTEFELYLADTSQIGRFRLPANKSGVVLHTGGGSRKIFCSFFRNKEWASYNELTKTYEWGKTLHPYSLDIGRSIEYHFEDKMRRQIRQAPVGIVRLIDNALFRDISVEEQGEAQAILLAAFNQIGVLNLSGYPVELEEYDDLDGDNPGCNLGVTQRLFQVVLGNPLCSTPPLTPELAKEKFWNFVEQKLSLFLGERKRQELESFVKALNSWSLSKDELTDVERKTLSEFSIGADQIANFYQEMVKIYGLDFAPMNPTTAGKFKFKRLGNKLFEGYKDYIREMADDLYEAFEKIYVVVNAYFTNLTGIEKTYRERWAQIESDAKKLDELQTTFLAQKTSQMLVLSDALDYALAWKQIENPSMTPPTTAMTATTATTAASAIASFTATAAATTTIDVKKINERYRSYFSLSIQERAKMLRIVKEQARLLNLSLEERLFRAIQDDNYDVVKLLISGELTNKKYMNVNAIRNGNTPLDLAVQLGHILITLALINCGASLHRFIFLHADIEDIRRTGILSHEVKMFIAVLNNDANTVRRLISGELTDMQYMDVNQVRNGAKPLDIALENGYWEIAQLLANCGASAIRNNLATGDYAILCKRGFLSHEIRLHFAVQKNDSDTVRKLISGELTNKESMELNQVRNGATPLDIAFESGYWGIAQLLVNCGAKAVRNNLTASDYENLRKRGLPSHEYRMHFAVQRNDSDTVRRLISGELTHMEYMNVNEVRNGYSPLDRAIEDNYWDIAGQLIACGASCFKHTSADLARIAKSDQYASKALNLGFGKDRNLLYFRYYNATAAERASFDANISSATAAANTASNAASASTASTSAASPASAKK